MIMSNAQWGAIETSSIRVTIESMMVGFLSELIDLFVFMLV